MHEAMFYERTKKKEVECGLCPHRCKIANQKRGTCGVRENREGVLYSLVYGRAISWAVDPIEKKPLYHFHPGSDIFSIATVGCNLRCGHCQNHNISQLSRKKEKIEGRDLSPERIISQAKATGCLSIAYTYTEPTIFFEYAYDTSILAKQNNLNNVFVTNGYMSEEALKEVSPFLDAANCDLKSFSEDHYRKICGGRLKFVLHTLELMKELGIWLEVTTLVIPTLNDSEGELRKIAEFILQLGKDTPWHISRFYPSYRMRDLPPTPLQTLHRARQIGLDTGLRYVYTGNVPADEGESTYCYQCGRPILERYGYHIKANHIRSGECEYCKAKIDGVGL